MHAGSTHIRLTEPSTTSNRTGGNVSCSTCVELFTDVQHRLVPESEAEIVAEHVSACPDCRLFTDQLDTTRRVLAATPSPDIAELIGRDRQDRPDGGIDSSFRSLQRIASALDPDSADDLLQQTLVDAITSDADLNAADLINRMVRASHRKARQPLISLDDDRGAAPIAYDIDSDTAELFYPEFYVEGPDAGRFVDSPNTWGMGRPLPVDDQLTSNELFEVTDAAIDQLPPTQRRLITLVDLNGVDFTDAAAALHIPTTHASRSLNAARLHIRGALDRYVTATGDPNPVHRNPR